MQRDCFSPSGKISKPVTGELQTTIVNQEEKKTLRFRIPLHLFPIETQNKILEVEEAPEQQTDSSNEKYVDASSFRQTAPVHGRQTPEELSLR